jgi:peptide/nickel transport system substrate-binding protein
LWTWMGMNTDHPKLSDIRVRKAIQYAVDVRSILEAAYGGVGPLSHGVVPPGLIGHRESGAFDKQDVEKAKGLLAEAGVSNLTLNIKVLNQTANLTAAQIIQANLADVGITLDITPMDAGPFWNLGIEEKGDEWKDLQLWIMRFGDTPDPSQMTQWYVSDQVGVWNWERWKNPEFDELHKKGLVESDPKVRNDIYLRMQQIMEDTGAYVWITHEPYLAIYRDTIEPVILPGPHPFFPWFKWV